MWSVAGAHHGDLQPRHPSPWGGRSRRTLTLAHQLSGSSAMKKRGQRKDKWHYFHLSQHGSLHHGKLSNPLNVTGCADRNLTALAPNLHLGCHKPHLSFWALSFCWSETDYCAKPSRHFCWQEWDFHRHRPYLKTVVQQQWQLSLFNLENIRTPLIEKCYLCTLTYLNTNFKGVNYLVGIKDSINTVISYLPVKFLETIKTAGICYTKAVV